jgi:hypothetical protein
VISVAIKGNAPQSGAALFDNQTALSDLIKELQDLEKELRQHE